MSAEGRTRLGDGAFALTIPTWLCISLWHQRTGGLAGGGNLTRDLLGSLLLLWGFAALGMMVPRLRADSVAPRAALLATLGCATLLFASWAAWFGQADGAGLPALVTWAAGLLVATLVAWFVAARAALARTTLNVGGLVLLAFAVPKLLPAFTGAEVSTRVQDRRDGRTPDVYVFVLDKYTSGAALAAAWDHNHRPFEDSLRALGFVVPTLVRANYAHTKLAIPAFLEGEYPVLPDDGSGGNAEFEALSARIADSPLWRQARAAGYRVFGFTTLFEGTRVYADSVQAIRAPQHADARWAETLVLNSPLPALRAAWCGDEGCDEAAATPYPVRGIETLDWQLRQVRALGDSAGPVFAFVHLLAPHEPYLFTETCGRREPWWPFSDQIPNQQGALQAAYVAQVRCLDQRLYATVRALLERPGVPPVILLQGDHGHGRLSAGWFGGASIARETIAPRALADRLTVFGAYRFPGADSLLAEETTPVNVMRALKRALSLDAAALLPDRTFWSPYQSALRLEEIDPSQIRAALTLPQTAP